MNKQLLNGIQLIEQNSQHRDHISISNMHYRFRCRVKNIVVGSAASAKQQDPMSGMYC